MGSGGQRFWRQGRLSQHDSLDRGATLSAPFAFSAGTASARTSLPAQACDAHIHVYDSRFPAVVGASLHPPDATIEDYRLVQQRMGTERAVLVTPSTYGADNRPMLAGLAQLGSQGRGVAVITGEPASRMAAVSNDSTGEEDRRLKREDIESAPGYESYSCEPNQIGISCIG